MGIALRVIDERYNIIAEIGVIDTDDMRNLIKIAGALDLKCLSLADYIGDTFFNEKKCSTCKKK